MSELKPCPFCGSTAIVTSYTPEDDGYLDFAKCLKCDARGPACYTEDNDGGFSVVAAKAWNGRDSCKREKIA